MDFSKLEGLPPLEVQATPVVPGRTLHIDADILAYQFSGLDNLSHCRRALVNKVQRMIDVSGAEHTILETTAPGSTKGDRSIIATVKPYQAQRTGSKKPQHYERIRNFIVEELPKSYENCTVRQATDREADDFMAMYDKPYDQKVIATKDKDLRMVPGIHMHWDTYETILLKPWEYRLQAWDKDFGLYWFLRQTLQGDTADNIPGLPKHSRFLRGVGEAAATKILAEAEDFAEGLSLVIEAYTDYYGDLESGCYHWVEQAMLLWMRTDTFARCQDFLSCIPLEHEYEVEIIEASVQHAKRVRDIKEEAAWLNA